MKIHSYKRKSGIALFQVLIMTTIMSLIALGFTFAARHQIETAKAFSDRFVAETKMKTAESELFYVFFKYDSFELGDKVQEGIKWNLRGQPFELSPGVEVELQTVVGLFSVITTPERFIIGLLNKLGVPQDKQSEILYSIQDWVDTDSNVRFGGAEDSYYQQTDIEYSRNGPLQHISELRHIKGIDQALYEKLAGFFTIYVTQTFNPAQAPDLLVRSVLPEVLAEQIIEMNRRQDFSQQTWRDIVGSSEIKDINVHPYTTFLVKIRVVEGDVNLIRQFDIKIQSQKSKDPIIILRRY